MQTFDVTKPPQGIITDDQLLNVLKDIVHKVVINPDFSIHHPDYQPFAFPHDIRERLQKLSTEMQQNYISLQLRRFLYGIYYNGSLRSELAPDKAGNNFVLDLENNTLFGVDLSFYDRLHDNNHGEGYFEPGWSVIKEESDGSLVVSQGGLRLHIERDRHLKPQEKAAVVGDVVEILMPKNLVQNGFYMAVSNSGLSYPPDSELQIQPITVRIYFNLTPDGAVAVMSQLTQQLNEKALPFSFKVLYNPKDYNRYDSGVLYFDQRDYPVVKQILNIVYEQTRSHFKPEVPLFTKKLASGLGLAEEPNYKFDVHESFGLNRCQIVANGLLAAWEQGNDTPEGRLQAIYEQFSLLNIDYQLPYLNANSADIY